MSLPFDPARLIAALMQRWKVLPSLAVCLALPVLLFGIWHFKSTYSVTVQLIRREASTAIKESLNGEAFKPRQVTVATVVDLMMSPKLLESVGKKAHPPLSDKELGYSLVIKPEKDTDLINVTLKMHGSAREASDLLNNYASDVVALTARMQADEAGELNRFLASQLDQLDNDLAKVNVEITEISLREDFALRLNQARDQLAQLQASYTDENPQVFEAKDKLASLEKEAIAAISGSNNGGKIADSKNSITNDIYLQLLNYRSEKENTAKQFKLAAQQQSLQAARDMLAGRQREAQMFEENAPGLYRLFAPATEDNVEVSSRWRKIILVMMGALFLGAVAGVGLICWRELLDMRVISAGDLKRVSGLKVVARLADMNGWSPQEISQWRFRIWAQMMRDLKLPAESRVTLAFTSANAGEGKSVFIRHLRDAARDRNFQVVTVVNSPTSDESVKPLAMAEALQTPDTVIRHLREQPGAPLELRLEAGWGWTLENRARWQHAMQLWRQIPSLILLVELPAMNSLEAVLAAELMPAVLWITASGEIQQNELAARLETVEAAEVPLCGAVLNREPTIFSKLSFLSKIGLASIALFSMISMNANAMDTNATGQLSAFSQAPQLGSWQKRFTVGAGDIFNLRIYGRTDSPRVYVPVSPDGRISFMEAQSVLVAGLTVDEMRAKLDKELSKYYKNVRTIVTPVEWHSKKYFVLGAVVDRGAYALDRPLTIIEAVARARGIASGLFEHNTVELADMARAFIVRDGQRLPVDFDRLFKHGDLSQNILIEPDDYIYFPSGTVNEVYVLGAVASPGPLGLTSENTLMGVLTVRGGFLPTAFKQRVLVVRGSLEKPQPFVVNVGAILTGKEKDFTLKPKDIIYVSEKPWQEGTDLLQMAVNAFVQSMTSAWVNNHVRPLITN